MQAHIVLISIYCVARVLHTVIYSMKLSRPRSAVFGVGLFSLLGLCINATVAAFTASKVDFASR